jgi:pyrroline-5-carboxylate reductase
VSNTQKISFIGAGNMARSLVSGLLRNGHPSAAISAADPMPGQREQLAGLGIVVHADNDAAAAGADVVVLAVKPQVLKRVLEAMTLSPEQLVVSIAAGVNLQSLARWTAPSQPIVRCMPNTPALLGAGVTALFANEHATPAQRDQAEAVLAAAGRTLWVAEESLLDAVTAVSGSGPAYFFYLMESMIEAGQRLGLDADTATLLTLETAYGAALMAREGSDSPATLREKVTSPGGTTERALSILDAAGTRESIASALEGAAEKARELAQESGQP